MKTQQEINTYLKQVWNYYRNGCNNYSLGNYEYWKIYGIFESILCFLNILQPGQKFQYKEIEVPYVFLGLFPTKRKINRKETYHEMLERLVSDYLKSQEII